MARAAGSVSQSGLLYLPARMIRSYKSLRGFILQKAPNDWDAFVCSFYTWQMSYKTDAGYIPDPRRY
jgi:hypothetical protein